ncbi:C4-dicarboxylate transporter, DctM subunit [Modicisalibacter muralis]|uniref:TRAP transporter large permease protein n=1 Tax=Modicisalibacter muralis TaxID=119000 RepID=A0A1G9LL07_9GAMM|nr:TRAP transporter large permease [Halomonas muralis]SDL62503.1 C4-dicarboxylate transporter, DctM subunit [Halomonas muralis]
MDGMLIALLSVSAAIMFTLGVPVLLVIGHWVLWVSIIIDFSLNNLSMTLFEGINFFGLLALPLFILTGDIINGAGIAKRMTDFAYSLFGWLRGGLGLAVLGACGMFSAISGSNAATTATIGSIMHKEMKEGNYDARFSAATMASGGIVGVIIPPSILLIIYGFLMGLPVGELFLAGLLPGILLVLGMQAICLVRSRRNNWGQIIPFSIIGSFRSGARAYLGFIAIAIVLFGIYGGAFSPSEAGAITVAFGLIAGTMVTRELSLRKLPTIFLRSGQIAGMIVPLVAVSVVLQQLLSILGVPEQLKGLVTSLAAGYWLTLAMCMAMILIAGSFLESVPVTIILAPILAPIMQGLGIDPIHFAVIFVIGTAIGFITPPFGLNLFVASSVTGVPLITMLSNLLPYFVTLMVIWILIVIFPSLTTVIPALSAAF